MTIFLDDSKPFSGPGMLFVGDDGICLAQAISTVPENTDWNTAMTDKWDAPMTDDWDKPMDEENV